MYFYYMGLIIIGFGCGIGFTFLLRKLEQLRKKDFKAGDEDVCESCSFHKTVMDSIEEISSNN